MGIEKKKKGHDAERFGELIKTEQGTKGKKEATERKVTVCRRTCHGAKRDLANGGAAGAVKRVQGR